MTLLAQMIVPAIMIIDPASMERYLNCVLTSLPTLFDELQNCSDPDCKSH